MDPFYLMSLKCTLISRLFSVFLKTIKIPNISNSLTHTYFSTERQTAAKSPNAMFLAKVYSDKDCGSGVSPPDFR